MKPKTNYRAVFETAPLGIFRLGTDGALIDANQSMAKIFGYRSARQMLNHSSDFAAQAFVVPQRWNEIIRQLPASGLQCGIQSEVHVCSGGTRWVQMNVWAVLKAGKVTHYEGTAEDITERKAAEEKIRLLAYGDSLTGLPNRSWFEERLGQVIDAARWDGRHVALLLVEVSRFPWIDDSYGKAVVNGVLQEIAERIRWEVDESASVARLEGAKFAILLEGRGRGRHAKQIGGKIMAALRKRFTFRGHSLYLAPAMGGSIFPKDGKDESSVAMRAELALGVAKESGRNEIQFFREEMEYGFRERVRIESSLMLALERKEFSLVYQPQLDIQTGGISGLEALLRWQHPELGLVPPGEFIAVAECSGLIVLIGEWVLRTACMQARAWQDAGLPAVPVAVNVSPVQLRRQGFCDLVRRILQESGLDPKYLELELTEGNLLKNVDVLAVFQELREIGVKLAIDDFGTGYSSFSYLRQFKVNRLKIDGSFVREVPENENDAAITTAILNLARTLHMDVLAEGVENAQQLEFLRKQNCHGAQGFYISNPVAAEQIYDTFRTTLIKCA